MMIILNNKLFFCFDTGIVLASVTYKGSMRVCANADSAYLTKQELEGIMTAIPKIVEDMAKGN